MRTRTTLPALLLVLSLTAQNKWSLQQCVQRAEERNLSDFIDMVLAIDRTLSPAQRQHLLKELRTLRTELYELSIGA